MDFTSVLLLIFLLSNIFCSTYRRQYKKNPKIIPKIKNKNVQEKKGNQPILIDNDIFRIARPIYHWPKGVVQYYIDTKIYDEYLAKRIYKAMNALEMASCLIFDSHPYEYLASEKHSSPWLHITNPKNERECVHGTSVGNHGEAVLVLGFDCLSDRDILHALMHAVGFKDEVTHPQRDIYVRIMWDNIQPQYRNLFTISNGPLHTFVEYDPMSIMHFHDRAFTKNGGATIVTLIPGLIINPQGELSVLDKTKLRLAYGHECNKRKVKNVFDTCKNSLNNDNVTKKLNLEYGSSMYDESDYDDERKEENTDDSEYSDEEDGNSIDGGISYSEE